MDASSNHRTGESEVQERTILAAKPWNVRRATCEDVEALVTLEQVCFSTPWSKKNIQAEIEGNQFSHVFVIPHSEDGQEIQVIGYICAWIVFEEIRFLNLAIQPEYRRRGLASLLIGVAIDLGKSGGCCRGMLEVRASNQAAKNLYERFQFQSYARRTSYYTNPTEDAILMTLDPLVCHIEEGGMSATDQLVRS